MGFSFDLADVKPSVYSWFVVGIMAVSFILVMRFTFTILLKRRIAGFSDLFEAV